MDVDSPTGMDREHTADGDAQALLERADAMRPLIERHAGEQERLGRLHDEVVEAFHAAGFFGITTPRELGGSELTPRQSLELLARVSYADASTGWVLFATSGCTGLAGAFLGDDAVAEIFGGARMPIIAGQGTRPGTAVSAGDGYRLSGEWSFGSGIKHAQWTHSGGIVQETGEMKILVAPREDAQLSDNWDVMGLRATGSIDYTMRDVHVPASFTQSAVALEPRRGGAYYTIGLVPLASLGHTGWALGVGRRLLDELQALVAERRGRPGGVADNEAFLIGYADAEARLRAARALVHETWAGIEAKTSRGESLDVRDNTLLRLALTNTTWSTQAVAEFVYQWSGTTGLRSGIVQRFFRDVHAGTQHITSGPGVRAACGRELVGAAPQHEWTFLSLQESAR
jgi:alkylation response protein AidB-like acyl-CoA dehydrogenase